MITANDVLFYFAYKYNSDTQKMIEAIKNKERASEEELEKIKQSCNEKFITIMDERYPMFLKNILNPPLVLFYRGNINLLFDELNPKIAIIGSRDCSDYGKKSCKEIIKELPKNYSIVSGLAKGIDAIGHESALDNKLKTIAIIGSGFNKFYPKENYNLYKRIIENDGLVMTEYFPDSEPEAKNFVARNRIIAALSDFVLVGEAYEKSGTSITVSNALAMGKDVGCIPYERCKNSQCNLWIKQGAYLIETGNDIVQITKK